MRIRTIVGGVALGLTLTASLATPALATGETSAPPTSASPTASVSPTATASSASSSASTSAPTSSATTQACTGQTCANAGTQINQSCSVKGKVDGSVYCVQVAGTLVIQQVPAECAGKPTCDALPTELPAATVGVTCEKAAAAVKTAVVNGIKVDCGCQSAGAKTVTIKRAAAESESLPVTGADAGTIAMAGTVAVVLGGAALGFWMLRRRRVSFTA